MTLYTPIQSGLGSGAVSDEVKAAISDALTKDQEVLVIPSVPVNTWTNFPDSTQNAGRTIAGFSLRSSSGESLPLDTRLSGGKWQVLSAIALTNVQIYVEF